MHYDDRLAELYDQRFRKRFDEAAAAAAFLAELDRPPGPVLELGVGTGRLALPLVACGLDVHGVDASPAMIARLRDKPGGDRISVVIGDFVDVPALVEERFSLAFLAFNTLFELGSQDEQVRCFRGVAERLLPGGLFVVEAVAPDLSDARDGIAVIAVDDGGVRLQDTHHDPLAQVITGETVTVADTGTERWPWSIRYATVPEIDLMARLAGLRLRERHGGWSGEPFTAGSARHVSVYELVTQNGT